MKSDITFYYPKDPCHTPPPPPGLEHPSLKSGTTCYLLLPPGNIVVVLVLDPQCFGVLPFWCGVLLVFLPEVRLSQSFTHVLLVVDLWQV